MTLYTSKASPALRPARAQGPYTASAVARSTEGEHLGAPLRGRAREDRPGSTALGVRAREDRPGSPLGVRAREDRPGSPLRVRAREDRPDSPLRVRARRGTPTRRGARARTESKLS